MMAEIHRIREQHYLRTKTASCEIKNRSIINGANRFLSSYGFQLISTGEGSKRLVKI